MQAGPASQGQSQSEANGGRRVPGLSAFVIARDEGDRIARCLTPLLELAEEVVLVDSGSRDDTVAQAEALGVRVIHNGWPGYGPQKRFAEEQCRNDWLLNLDADEILSPELATEVRSLFAEGAPPKPFYRLRVLEVLPGHETPLKRGRVYRIVRLYDRRAGRYADHPTFDRVKVPEGAQVGLLEGPVLHHSFRSLSHMVEKLNRYSDAQAAATGARAGWILHLRLLFEFPFSFVKSYFFRGLIWEGWDGFAYAVTRAFVRFLRVAKILERVKRR